MISIQTEQAIKQQARAECLAEIKRLQSRAEAAAAQAAQYQRDLAVALETETRQARRATEAEAESDSLRQQVAALRAALKTVINGQGNSLTTASIDLALDALEATKD